MFPHRKDTTVAAAARQSFAVVTVPSEKKECANETEGSGEREAGSLTTVRKSFQKDRRWQKVSENFGARKCVHERCAIGRDKRQRK